MRFRKQLLLTLVVSLFAVIAFGQKYTSDAQIVAEIQDRLYHARIFQHGQVQVGFSEGVVTLTGTVDSVGVKWDAEHAARKAEDVTRVVDNINVSSEDVTDRQIIEKARKDILTYYAYGIYDWLQLEAQSNTLTVSGEVSQPFKKQDIGNFLAHIKGVADLKNNLEVLPLSNYDDSLRITIARAIFNDPYFALYANQAIPPIHIIVKNGNVTLKGVVNSEVDRAKAFANASAVSGYLSLNNELQVERK